MARGDSHKAVTRNVTVMFTDIKGFTARVSGGSREDLAVLRRAHDRLLVPVFKHFNGTIIKSIGDAFLVRFESPTDAVLCGVTLQEVLRQNNAFAKEEKDRFDVRVSINVGDVDISENDVLGEPVNIAARLQSIAEIGEVYFTEAVYLSMNRKEAPSASIGEHTFKGIPYPVRVYKVSSDPDSELTKKLHEGVRLTDQGPVIKGISPMSPGPKKLRWFTYGAITATLLLVVAFITLRPTPIEKAQRAATAAMQKDDPASALAIVLPLLKDHSDNPNLAGLAAKSAEAHLDKLRVVGYDKALQWLREQMAQYPHLEMLRKHEGVLEAQSLATSFIDTEKDAWQPLLELCNRYPNDPNVPHAAGAVLQGKIFPYAPLKLYELSLKRGYSGPRDAILNYCFSLFERHHPGNVMGAHQILQDYFPSERIAWAKQTITTTASGILFIHAHKILSDLEEPLIEDPLVAALLVLMTGYENEANADQALAFFEANVSASDRLRVINLHRWVIKPSMSWSWRNKPLTERNLKALEAKWALTAGSGGQHQ